MKRVYISLCILLLIAGTCVFSAMHFRQFSRSFADTIGRVSEAALANRPEKAAQQLLYAHKLWTKDRMLLSFLLDRDALDEMDRLLQRAAVCVQFEDETQLVFLCTEVDGLLQTLFEDVIPTVSHIF